MREIEASPMRSGYCDCCEGVNKDQIVKIARFTGCKNFVGKRKKFIFNAFIDLSQWRDLRIGVICEDLGALTTARAREFWIFWSRLN